MGQHDTAIAVTAPPVMTVAAPWPTRKEAEAEVVEDAAATPWPARKEAEAKATEKAAATAMITVYR